MTSSRTVKAGVMTRDQTDEQMAQGQLSVEERARFQELEVQFADQAKVAKQAWVKMGDALREIRDQRLYREDYRSFLDYCQERWGWDQERARQLIGSAAVVHNLTAADVPGENRNSSQKNATDSANLSPTRVGEKNSNSVAFSTKPPEITASSSHRSPRTRTLLPESEKQVRPLTSVPSKDQPKVWNKAVESAGGRQPTEKQVRVALKQIRDGLAESEDDTAERLLRLLNKAVRQALDFGRTLSELHELLRGKTKLVGDGSLKLRAHLDQVLRYTDEIYKLLPAK